MNSVLPVWITDLENLKKPGSGRPSCGSLGLQHKAHSSASIEARMKWCRTRRTPACTQVELEGWRAEEEGLWDALFKRDHTDQYRDRPPAVFERYAMGLREGQALIHPTWVDCIWQPAAKGTQV